VQRAKFSPFFVNSVQKLLKCQKMYDIMRLDIINSNKSQRREKDEKGIDTGTRPSDGTVAHDGKRYGV